MEGHPESDALFFGKKIKFTLQSNPIPTMKKLSVCCLLLLFAVQARSQGQLPFADYLSKTHYELHNENFRYHPKFNRFTKKESSIFTDNLVLGIFGAGTNVPGKGDFSMTLQFGEESLAWLRVRFHNDEQYTAMVRLLNETGIQYTEVDINYGSIITFTDNGVGYTLKKELQVGTVSYKNNSSQELYNTYTYTIDTGVEPSSKWHGRHAKKAERGQGQLAMAKGEFIRFPEITYPDIHNGYWSATYNIGTVDPMTITESIIFLSDCELRYRRVNEMTDAVLDFIMSYAINGNSIQAEYRQHSSGGTQEGLEFYLDIYIRPVSVLWLAKNGDYTDIKRLRLESDKQ